MALSPEEIETILAPYRREQCDDLLAHYGFALPKDVCVMQIQMNAIINGQLETFKLWPLRTEGQDEISICIGEMK